MVTFTVLKFPTLNGARSVESTLFALQQQHCIEFQDAASLLWVPGARLPETQLLPNLVEQSTLSNAFWHMLFSLIFSATSSDQPGDTDMVKPYKKFADYGISAELIEEVREKVTVGSSALFLLTRCPVVDEVVQALKDKTFEIILINLSKMQGDMLRVTFGDK